MVGEGDTGAAIAGIFQPDRVALLDHDKTYVVYCDGIGCNGSTKAAWKLAGHGFKIKELLGGLAFWREEGWPLARGEQAGTLQAPAIRCDC